MASLSSQLGYHGTTHTEWYPPLTIVVVQLIQKIKKYDHVLVYNNYSMPGIIVLTHHTYGAEHKPEGDPWPRPALSQSIMATVIVEHMATFQLHSTYKHGQ